MRAANLRQGKESQMAKAISARLQKQADKNTAFEKSTGKSHFSPTLRARRTEIAMWCDQGKNEDQILANLGGGVSREELKGFLAANNLTIKKVTLRKRWPTAICRPRSAAARASPGRASRASRAGASRCT